MFGYNKISNVEYGILAISFKMHNKKTLFIFVFIYASCANTFSYSMEGAF